MSMDMAIVALGSYYAIIAIVSFIATMPAIIVITTLTTGSATSSNRPS